MADSSDSTYFSRRHRLSFSPQLAFGTQEESSRRRRGRKRNPCLCASQQHYLDIADMAHHFQPVIRAAGGADSFCLPAGPGPAGFECLLPLPFGIYALFQKALQRQSLRHAVACPGFSVAFAASFSALYPFSPPEHFGAPQHPVPHFYDLGRRLCFGGRLLPAEQPSFF